MTYISWSSERFEKTISKESLVKFVGGLSQSKLANWNIFKNFNGVLLMHDSHDCNFIIRMEFYF